jgi:hypothetical protein
MPIQEGVNMPTMKIGEESQAYASAAFSFPNNPRVTDSQLVPNRNFTTVPYGMTHIVTDGGGVNPKEIVINGTMHGSSRRTNFNLLCKHIYDQNLKRFFISSDRFYYFVGTTIKETLSGERTNFIDYVASMKTPIPFALSDTQKSEQWTLGDANETEINSSNDDGTNTEAFSNAGNAPAFVKFVIVVGDGGSNITQIDIGDGSTLAGSSRKLTWSHTTGIAAGETLTIYMIKFVSQSSNMKFTNYAYPEKSSAEFGSRSLNGKREMPYVSPGETNQSFSVKLTGNDVNSTVTAYWHDAYLS